MDARDAALIHVVDPDLGEVNQWKEWLRPLRVPVRVYRTAEEFLTECTQPTPGCLLVGLPATARSSREAFAGLRCRNASIAVVLVESSISIAETVSAIKSGVFTVLERPLERDEFLTTVTQSLKQSRADWAAACSWTNLLQLLSEREREVVDLLLSGKSTKQIGKTLQISTSTVHKHRMSVFSKLRVDSSTDLVLKSAHFLSRSIRSE